MAKWAVQDKTEFEARQGCLEFGAACRFVLKLAVSVKSSLGNWAKSLMKNFKMPTPKLKASEQLKLNLLPRLETVTA